MSTTKAVGITVTSANGPVISTQIKIHQNVKGLYGCQGECKQLTQKDFRPFYGSTLKASYNIKTIVCILSKLIVETMIQDGWLYCKLCRFACHPDICPGKVRKFCPCCSTRLKFLKTVLKESRAKKIQDTILISRMDKD